MIYHARNLHSGYYPFTINLLRYWCDRHECDDQPPKNDEVALPQNRPKRVSKRSKDMAKALMS